MYQQAAQQLIAAADEVAEYRADLAAFADTVAGKGWGIEVFGPIQDMDTALAATEGAYQDLAAQMRHQGDQGAAAYDQAPWVPGNLITQETGITTDQPAPRPEGFDSVQDVFDYGYCHALALALHERTGWPIVGLHASKDPHAFHYLVHRPDGRLLDAHGARTPDDVLTQWGDGAPQGYYSVRTHTADQLWTEAQQGDMENPLDVWPLAQTTASKLAELPMISS